MKGIRTAPIRDGFTTRFLAKIRGVDGMRIGSLWSLRGAHVRLKTQSLAEEASGMSSCGV